MFVINLGNSAEFRLTRNYCLPLPPQPIISSLVILSHNPAHVKSEKMQVTGSASPRASLLAGGHVPFPLGTPSFAEMPYCISLSKHI